MSTPTAGGGADAVLRRVHDRLRERATEATAARVTVGDRLVLVEAEHPEAGHLAGVAHRPRGELPDRRDGDRPGGEVPAGPADGPGAWPDAVPDLVALAVESPADAHLRRAVGVATLGALSVPEVDWRPGDPMAALPRDADAVATVGLFRPALRKFDGVAVRVVEREGAAGVGDAEPPAGVDAVYPPAAAERAFSGADVVFVTGSTLVYGGLERYLGATADQVVVLVGATASILPGPSLDAGVDLVAGARVTDPGAVRRRVAAGDCATDLHGAGLEKCYVAAESPSDALRLSAGEATGGDRSVPEVEP